MTHYQDFGDDDDDWTIITIYITTVMTGHRKEKDIKTKNKYHHHHHHHIILTNIYKYNINNFLRCLNQNRSNGGLWEKTRYLDLQLQDTTIVEEIEIEMVIQNTPTDIISPKEQPQPQPQPLQFKELWSATSASASTMPFICRSTLITQYYQANWNLTDYLWPCSYSSRAVPLIPMDSQCAAAIAMSLQNKVEDLIGVCDPTEYFHKRSILIDEIVDLATKYRHRSNLKFIMSYVKYTHIPAIYKYTKYIEDIHYCENKDLNQTPCLNLNDCFNSFTSSVLSNVTWGEIDGCRVVCAGGAVLGSLTHQSESFYIELMDQIPGFSRRNYNFAYDGICGTSQCMRRIEPNTRFDLDGFTEIDLPKLVKPNFTYHGWEQLDTFIDLHVCTQPKSVVNIGVECYQCALATLFVVCSVAQQEAIRPVVMWHGMGDTCCYPFSMGRIKQMIEEKIPGIFVYSIEIGDSITDDEFNGFFKNVNTQVDMVCDMLKKNENLTNGFNAIGFSQGGQFLRAYVERCNDPPVYNLLSVGGQHQGVYGMPRCPGTNGTLCNMARELLNLGVYEEFVQEHLVQAEYWQDPINYQEYLDKSVFLADINNAGPTKNETYKKNLITLNEFVLVQFTEDTMVVPRESEWFGFYQLGQAKTVIPMEQTDLYTEDWIGMKYLDGEGRVTQIPCVGDHLQFTDQWFYEYMIPYMNNTITAEFY
ncbi:palmitoyl-protein thioesterase 1 [Cavenderia fasciculata]|uniref:Palmitoyl-protein thioesterase 1 n=1 Tax=Cavenderia fasciculata TaxID=261658 RepID=F4PRM6_CACFS|nr:palmitoyl-protein thioesterase 1 [Cavenderia fasciculata]EGG21366.1 palmitoyl-protein thioesterase 1 [Cavenderia fasciculata]|eukprot:XP_004359216.1 palmitoyl-protein thioesterase 1 [Cavenderia fasciculata]